MEKFNKLQEIGQSFWYDNIQRKLLINGELKRLRDRNIILGITSNPTIFNKAISSTEDYDDALKTLAWAGLNSEVIFYRLAIQDIQAACDLFDPIYRKSNGLDGFVSLEVNPNLANDSEKTVIEAQRLWNEVNRENLMIKIPATKKGITAVQDSIALGININVTLIFSLSRYEEIINAYLSGLEDRIAKDLPINKIASVASFFISRIDSKVDQSLQALIDKNPQNESDIKPLLGKIAIANAKLAYQKFIGEFSSDRYRALEIHGAKIQRPLWASTSTKNPSYKDTLYIDSLIAKNTINTVPPKTLSAFIDHGIVSESISTDLNEALNNIRDLKHIGVDLDVITHELEKEGVTSFINSYTELLDTIEIKRRNNVINSQEVNRNISVNLEQIKRESVIQRMFNKDATVWTNRTDEQKEIINRLGWLDAVSKSMALTDDIDNLRGIILSEGYTHGIVLGMGGSSLAPEVFSKIFTKTKNLGLVLSILDSTDPEHIKTLTKNIPVEKTLFIVSSKSGSTSEVHAFLEYFWDIVKGYTKENIGKHFIAITDPESPLYTLAKERGFRKIFLADPCVGGRYSALTAFGLVPAGLMGIDLNQLLSSTQVFIDRCQPDMDLMNNPGAVLGVIIASVVLAGKDKLTIIADGDFIHFGAWLEQLIAESSGKFGKGIIPIDKEPESDINKYGSDRLFIYLRENGNFDDRIDELQNHDHPVLTFNINNSNIGAEFYRWEYAVAVACAILGINAFDQPDVQDSKIRTVKLLNEYIENGDIKDFTYLWKDNNFSIYSNISDIVLGTDNISNILSIFLDQSKPEYYTAINAYLPRNEINLEILQRLRYKILEYTNTATSLGFGPRFLHSTGQLHKGGPNNCLIIQIVRNIEDDLFIPGKQYSFGTLINAQAMGDIHALISRDRPVLQIKVNNVEVLNEITF